MSSPIQFKKQPGEIYHVFIDDCKVGEAHRTVYTNEWEFQLSPAVQLAGSMALSIELKIALLNEQEEDTEEL